MKTWTMEEMAQMNPQEQFAVSEELTGKISALLAGHHPAVQSASLADCVALYIAGVRPVEAADGLLAEFDALVRQLIPVNRAMIDHRLRHEGTEL